MKSPWDAITELAFDHSKQAKENLRANFKFSDSFMTWIVGFSIAGISLIVGNVGKLDATFHHSSLKFAVVLLTISVISGVLYRWFYYLFQIQHQLIEYKIYGAFMKEEFQAMEPDDLTETRDIKDVLWSLKNDYDEDLSSELERYASVDDVNKAAILKSLIEHYHNVGNQVQKEYESTIEYVKNTYKEAYGLSVKQTDKIFKPSKCRLFKIYRWIVAITYFISCFSFIAVLLMLGFKF